MDDFMMYKYLKERTAGMNDEEFIKKMRESISRRNSMNDYDREWNIRERRPYKHTMPESYFGEDLRYGITSRNMRDSMGDHIDEYEAKDIVAHLCHTENGRKYMGEKYDMSKAREICERYRGILPSSVSPSELYLALNTHYHNYAELFKAWFGDNIDQKIIESAVVFWFKDENCPDENKIVSYFKD